MGSGAGLGAGVIVLVFIGVLSYGFSDSVVLTTAVLAGALASGLLLNAAYDRYVL